MNKKMTGALALLGLIGVAVYLTQTTAPTPLPQNTSGCQFEAQDALLFSFSQNGKTRQNQQALGQKSGFPTPSGTTTNDVQLQGRMLWEVAQPQPKGWRIHAQIKDFTLNHTGDGQTQDLEAQKRMLQEPFALDIDSRCRFVQFGFQTSVKTEVQQMLRGLLQNMEFVLPQQKPVPSQWRVKQNHALGQYVGVYQSDNGGFNLERAKEMAPSAHEKTALRKLQLKPQLNETQMTVARDVNGKWAQSIKGLEEMQLFMGSTEMAHMRYVYELKREKIYKHQNSIDFKRSVQWLDAKQGQAVQNKQIDLSALTARVPKMPYDALLARVQQLLDKKDYNAVWQFLALYFKAHPEVIATFMADIKAGKLADALESWAIMAMGKADVPEGDQALRTLLQDNTYPHRSRYRGVVAHLNMENIEQKNLDALMSLSNGWTEAGEGKPQVLASSARHMIGNQLSVMNKNGDARNGEMAEALEGWLEEAQPGFEQRVSMKSVGNSGDAQFFGKLKAINNSADDRTREVSYHAMRFMDTPESHAYFLDRIKAEPNAEAFKELSQTVSGQSFNDERAQLITMVGERLLRETNADIRIYLINILASVIEQAPEAKTYLQQQLRRERVVKVVKRLGEVMALANSDH